jgi:branched-chain amino acid transport system permease protein
MYIQLLNGIVYGSLLFIVASGLVMIYGLRRIVNFAHGAFYMVGAYVGYSLIPHMGFFWALAAAPIALFFAGIVLDLALFRRLQNRSPLVSLIATFGLLLIIEDAVRGIWGRGTLSINPPGQLSGVVSLLGSDFPIYRLSIVACGVCVIAALALWLRFTRMGLFVRAVSVDPLTTAVLGVSTDRLSAIVVGLGTALAGISGVLAGPLLSLSPTMGSHVLVDSFVVTVVGGLGSFVGAFVAAMVIGEIQVGGSVWLPEFASMLPFILMAAVLVWRPTGLFGNRV